MVFFLLGVWLARNSLCDELLVVPWLSPPGHNFQLRHQYQSRRVRAVWKLGRVQPRFNTGM